METRNYTDIAKYPGNANFVVKLHDIVHYNLYIFVYRGLNKQYYEEFIVPNEEVDSHLDFIGYFGEVYCIFQYQYSVVQSTVHACRLQVKLDSVVLLGGKLPRLHPRA